jgi:hypothetical protein
MKRSNSYSEFSFRRISDEENNQPRNISAQEHREKIQHYFHKFIDLLIDREITPMIRSRQMSIDTTSIAKNKSNVNIYMVRKQLELAAGGPSAA